VTDHVLVANADMSSYTIYRADPGSTDPLKLGRVTRVRDRHWIAQRFDAASQSHVKLPDWRHHDGNFTTRRDAVAAVLQAHQ
jgi:hypothetical protein